MKEIHGGLVLAPSISSVSSQSFGKSKYTHIIIENRRSKVKRVGQTTESMTNTPKLLVCICII